MFVRCARHFSADARIKTYDVVISGGGMVGSTMALALGKNARFKNCRIALIEASPKKVNFNKPLSESYSNRVSAINPSSRDLFVALDVWKHLRRPQIVNDMKIWGAYTEDAIHYKEDSEGLEDIAYIVENDDIVASVSRELESVGNVEVIYDARVGNVEMKPTEDFPAHLRLSNGDTCQCRLMIGADGANSEIRKRMAVQYLSFSYNTTAVVATLNIVFGLISTHFFHRNEKILLHINVSYRQAQSRFYQKLRWMGLVDGLAQQDCVNLALKKTTIKIKTGSKQVIEIVGEHEHPSNIDDVNRKKLQAAVKRKVKDELSNQPAQLDNKHCSLVWSTSHEISEAFLSLPSESFVDLVNEAFSSKSVNDSTVMAMKSILKSVLNSSASSDDHPLISGVVENSRAAFPLGFGHAVEYVRPNIALVGDAAHKVHPLAGQGVNLGFRDVDNLTSSLSNGLMCGGAIGDYNALKEYQQASQCANLPIMLAIDLIHRVYTSDFGLVRAIGTLGIQLTEQISPIKNLMRRVASS